MDIRLNSKMIVQRHRQVNLRSVVSVLRHDKQLSVPLEMEVHIQSFLDATDACIRQTREHIEFHRRWKHVNREFRQCFQYTAYAVVFFFRNQPYFHWTIDPNDRQLQAITCMRCGNYLVSSNQEELAYRVRCFCWSNRI